MEVTIWHNPRCSKSRQTLALLQERGIEPDVRLYLQDAPTVDELRTVLALLDKTPRELMRSGEADYQALGLGQEDLAVEALLEAMHSHPILIERPVVLANGKAALGRPPESVLEIL